MEWRGAGELGQGRGQQSPCAESSWEPQPLGGRVIRASLRSDVCFTSSPVKPVHARALLAGEYGGTASAESSLQRLSGLRWRVCWIYTEIQFPASDRRPGVA